jgi:hypothetical protein
MQEGVYPKKNRRVLLASLPQSSIGQEKKTVSLDSKTE